MSTFKTTGDDKTAKLRLESLERREMMAADYDFFRLNNGVLSISEKSAEQIVGEVSYEGSNVRVSTQVRRQAGWSWESETALFSKSQVKEINFHGARGDDQFKNNTAIHSKIYGNGGNNVLHGGSGKDVIYGQSGWNQQAKIYGGGGNDLLFGGNGNDLLDGGSGNDGLWGKEGNDTLRGGIGDDSYKYGLSNAKGYHQGTDTIDDSIGRNTLDLRYLWGEAKVDLAATGMQVVNDQHLRLTLTSDQAISYVYGTEFNDIIKGNNLDNQLFGKGGNDILEGRKGNDILIGDRGHDRYVFSGSRLGRNSILDTNGSNTLDLRGRGGSNVVDIALTSLQVVKSGHLELRLQTNTTIDNVWGSKYNDVIKGNHWNNYIWGNAGNDVIEGRTGNDTISGGDGNDRYVFAGSNLGKDYIKSWNGQNILDFRQRGGSVNVDLSRTDWQTVRSNHLYLKFVRSYAVDHVWGTRYNDTIRGNHLNNTIYGNGGNDTIHGRAGDDRLYGGSGMDGLFGGKGSDRIQGNSGADRYLYQKGDTIGGRESTDAVLYFADSKDRSWKDSEIENMDIGLRSLHMRAGNTKLLKRADGGLVKFYRSVSQGNTLAVNHENGWIRFYDKAFTSSGLPAYGTTVHEMAHNWDDGGTEGPLLNQFKAISGWRRVNGNWVHHPNATFSSSNGDYAKNSPYEDIAESWETYFYGSQAEKRHIQAKINAIDAFFNSIAG